MWRPYSVGSPSSSPADGGTARARPGRLRSARATTPSFSADASAHVHDVWAQADLGVHKGGYVAVDIEPRDAAFLRLSPAMDVNI